MKIRKYKYYKNSRPCVRAVCENEKCQKEFWAEVRYRKSSLKGHALFCSRKCFFESDRFNPPIGKGKKNSNWKGGISVTRGYLIHSAGKNRGHLVHVVMAENVLGRRLKKNECVHHFNGNKQDNRNKNFLICTLSYHGWLEAKMAYIGKQLLFGGGCN